MAGLVDHRGNPLSSANYRKSSPPILGEAFGNWAGRDDLYMYQLPGGGFLQFDLSKLTIQDYRQMRDHYQVQASLSVLTFMLHQLDYTVVSDNKKIADLCQHQLDKIWTRLVRGMSQSFWAGYSPMILQWENDINSKTVELTKVKDLIPEECRVNWKRVDGYVPPGQPHAVPPKIKVYNGIKQWGYPYPIPVENTLWYPVLSENGDYYGRKLLRSAFQPYFFSMLLHLFANRYYERFGEPVPIGRAPYDQEVNIAGQMVPGNVAMQQILSNIRNRAVVVLPDDRDDAGTFDYQVEYLESQMRGADFERYMTRLDEEISLALFTPLLMLRTADVGSYNLGAGQTQVYLWMLNAIAGDWAEYIDKYVLKPMKNYNFGENAPMAQIRFRKLGTNQQETLRAVLTQMVRVGEAKVNVEDLGQALGMRVEEIKAVTQPPANPAVDPNADPNANPPNPTKPAPTPAVPKKDTRVRARPKQPKGIKQTSRVAALMADRVAAQYSKAYREGSLDTFTVDLGFHAQMITALDGICLDPADAYTVLEDRMSVFLDDFIACEEYEKGSGPDCIRTLIDLWTADVEKGAF